MIFSYYECDKLPIAVIDNFYDSTAQEKIMQELLFLNNDPRKLLPPEKTAAAHEEGVNELGQQLYLKKNKGCFLDRTYMDRSFSNILIENRKLFCDEVISELVLHHPIFKYLRLCNKDVTLVSYYENEDYYAPHRDDATLTALTWFYKTPKMFNGGQLVFEESLQIECLYNRCVIFPSILLHTVKEVEMDQSNCNKNLGRFTISQFICVT